MTAIRRIQNRTRGFTLLEILLALGLSVVLLLAVAAAIDLYRRMTFAGQDEVSEARLVRAVLRKIETDIRSIVPPQSQVTTPSDSSSGSSSGTTSGSGSSGSSSSSSSGTTQTQSQQTAMMDPLQNVAAQTVFGLYGDQRTLVMTSLCSHRPIVGGTAMQQANAAQPTGSTHGDLKTVAYFVTGNGVGGSSAPAQSDTGAPTSGLARLEGDHLAIGYSMMQSGSLASQARLIAPEVTSIAFRYFDGTQWQTTWDAEYLQVLPKAIECTITVQPSEETVAASAATTGASQVQPRVYRQVIAISTMAQPVPINQLATLPTGVVP